MTLSGIGIMAKQEFRMRLRTGRWRWLLASWVAVIALFSGLLRLALTTRENEAPAGIPLFGGLMLFVLGLALLVAPALTAQSINGDRERGTLATLQVTRLSASEIVLGKLLAAWGTALVFLAFTLPFVVWAIIEGGVGVGRASIVLLIMAVLLGVVCAVSQALSALLPRGITATMLSYLMVFAMTAGTLIVFVLALPLTTRTEPVEPGADARSSDSTVTEAHPEYIWWLLTPNPFAVLADAAPQPPLRWDAEEGEWEPQTEMDPLSTVGLAVRASRGDPSEPVPEWRLLRESPPVWPYGFGVHLLLGAGSVFISTRCVSTPVYRLTKGVRIA